MACQNSAAEHKQRNVEHSKLLKDSWRSKRGSSSWATTKARVLRRTAEGADFIDKPLHDTMATVTFGLTSAYQALL